VNWKKLTQSWQIAIAVAAMLLVGLIGYFAVVKPQKGKAAELSTQIAAEDTQIAAARALLANSKNVQKVRVADLFRLTKAMPDDPDEAGIVLELTNVARQTGITFESISPEGSTSLSGYQVVPINVVFEGNFFQLNDFLFRLRNLVDVRRGALAADGRLFTVDSINFAEGALKFPQIQATLILDAYVYGSSSTVTAPTQTTTGAPGTTTPGTTTPATTTPAAAPTTTTTTPSAAAAPGSSGAAN